MSAAGAPDPTQQPGRSLDEDRWARREHALESLLELGCEMAVSVDLFQTADLLLFNLMGHFGCSRAGLWMVSEDPAAPAVLVRSQAFDVAAVRAAAAGCDAALRGRFATSHSTLRLESQGDGVLGPDAAALRQSGVALVTPLHGQRELVGWVALGRRVTGAPYEEADIRIIEATLGLVGMVFQNARLYNRVLETNRQLRASNEHLTELDRAKSEFLSNVNHELRTPLAVVIGTLDLLSEHPDVPEKTRGLMAGALQRSRDLCDMLERLMTFSDSVSGRLVPQLVEDDIGPLLETFHAERLPGATVSLHPFTFARSPVLPLARFDPRYVRLILGELLDNALKFTPGGTAIHLQVRTARVGDVDHVSLALHDDGPGVPPEREEAMFRPFEQVDGSSCREVGGMGMGLALARQLAQDMGGDLLARTASGQGTTITLLLRAV